jgi:diaminopimelate decarboxylase
MLEGTIPNREARPPVQPLSEAAARFGTPVYVIGMAEVAAGVRAARLLTALPAARQSDRPQIDTIDSGGGFPLPADGAPGPEAFRSALLGALHDAGLELPPRPAIEPGRYLAGAAGWLVASVLHARGGARGSQQVVLDAGMTEFIRPALYGSRHSAHALRTKAPAGQAGRGRWAATGLLDTDLEGPVCESTDSFGRHVLPPLDRGDLVAIEQAGAYGASFTSCYNGRPPPGEVLLWLDGSLQPCERPPIRPVALTPGRRAIHRGEAGSAEGLPHRGCRYGH